MKAAGREAAAAAAAAGAVAALVVLYRRLARAQRALEALAERVQAHETGLGFLTQEFEALRPAPSAAVVAGWSPPALPSTPAAPPPFSCSRARPPADEDGMSEAMGYRTADEDEGDDLPPPPFGPPASLDSLELHARQVESQPEVHGFASAGGWACITGEEGTAAVGAPAGCAPPLSTDSHRPARFSGTNLSSTVSGSTSGDEGEAYVAPGGLRGPSAPQPALAGHATAAQLSSEISAADGLYAARDLAGAMRVLTAAAGLAATALAGSDSGVAPADAAVSPLACEVEWRLARLLKEQADADKESAARLSGKDKESAREKEKDAMRKALAHATEALRLDEGSCGAHKWYAICLSVTSGYEGTKATIQQSFVVRQHFEAAVRLNPRDATSRHLLGLWFYEVANLSWAMRKVAAALFAAPPTGTYAEAHAHFTAAEELSPGFYLKNRLCIAQCCLAQSDKVRAKEWLVKTVSMRPVGPEEEASHAEAKKLLASL